MDGAITMMAVVTMAASAFGVSLGWPTFATGLFIFLGVCISETAAISHKISWSSLLVVAGRFVLAVGLLREWRHRLARTRGENPVVAFGGVRESFARHDGRITDRPNNDKRIIVSSDNRTTPIGGKIALLDTAAELAIVRCVRNRPRTRKNIVPDLCHA
ncbi:hypothetical protein AB4Y35_36830 [Paraburkholderia sp. EG286A]|uniref:hypothetical protein n=1 Tax=Paraburkholderia sp. EG286A TaxID=3237014 RepID=UPI0034D37ECD